MFICWAQWRKTLYAVCLKMCASPRLGSAKRLLAYCLAALLVCIAIFRFFFRFCFAFVVAIIIIITIIISFALESCDHFCFSFNSINIIIFLYSALLIVANRLAYVGTVEKVVLEIWMGQQQIGTSKMLFLSLTLFLDKCLKLKL